MNLLDIAPDEESQAWKDESPAVWLRCELSSNATHRGRLWLSGVQDICTALSPGVWLKESTMSPKLLSLLDSPEHTVRPEI